MKGLKAILVLLVMTVSSVAVVITAPGMEPSSLTREKLIVIHFFKGYPLQTYCRILKWNCVVHETNEKNSEKYGSPDKGTIDAIV